MQPTNNKSKRLRATDDWLVANIKICIAIGGLNLLFINRSNTRKSRAAFQLAAKRRELVSVAFSDCFDRAIALISHRTGKPCATRGFDGKVAKAYALHSASDYETSGCHNWRRKIKRQKVNSKSRRSDGYSFA